MSERHPAIPESPKYRGMNGVSATAVIVCVTTILGIIIICGAFLAYHSNDAMSFRNLLNTLANIGSVILASMSTLYASAANNKAGTAAEQTNGSMDKRIREALSRVLNERIDDDPE